MKGGRSTRKIARRTHANGKYSISNLRDAGNYIHGTDCNLSQAEYIASRLFRERPAREPAKPTIRKFSWEAE